MKWDVGTSGRFFVGINICINVHGVLVGFLEGYQTGYYGEM